MSTINLTSSNFNEVVNSGKPVLIDFWASWCGPCRMQSPIVEEISEEVGETAVVAKVDVDENSDIAAQFSVMSIPTLVVIKDGKVVGQKVGVTQKADLLAMINSVTANR